ncbi:MAG: hypothetical protein PUD73_09170, partial [bacterium]|nr:hypothetical protein [bacterium]
FVLAHLFFAWLQVILRPFARFFPVPRLPQITLRFFFFSALYSFQGAFPCCLSLRFFASRDSSFIISESYRSVNAFFQKSLTKNLAFASMPLCAYNLHYKNAIFPALFRAINGGISHG